MKLEKRTRNQSAGFTLIEVVLVLAIGGLIFLLAFLAFQQVSTNRRDTQRRNDAGKVIAELQNYRANTTGTALSATLGTTTGTTAANSGICSTGEAATAGDFGATYLCKNGFFTSPSGVNYGSLVHFPPTGIPGRDQIKISVVFLGLQHNSCDGTTPLPEGSYKVEIGLEKGVVCRVST